MKCYFLILLLFTVSVLPQTERYTKGAENGYAWITMDDPALMYSISKENYLSSILDRIKLTKEIHPEIASLSCREEINQLATEGKSYQISLNDVVIEIDMFYLQNDNLIIPIIFAYCYTIKKFAGRSKEQLDDYREEILSFCFQ
jgi:hypothetical protein